MTAQISAELLKLRTTRTTWGVLAAALAIAALLGLASAGTGGDLVDVVAVSSLPAVVMFVVGVMAVAGEYQHHTITGTFLATPSRGRVLTAKLAAVGMAGPVVAVAVMAAATLVGLPALWIDGASVDLAGDVLEAAAGNLLAASLFGVIGVCLGGIVRNQLVAVVAAVGWTILGEGIVSVLVGDDAARWLPGFAAQSLASHGNDVLSMWAAAALLAGYAAVGALIASRLTLTRDVT
jgi:ABC-2 type transport system permease protein